MVVVFIRRAQASAVLVMLGEKVKNLRFIDEQFETDIEGDEIE